MRDFNESDAITLVQISNEAFGDELGRGMPSFTPERFASFSRRPDARILIAEDIEEVAGFLTLTQGNVETPAQIHLVAVRESFRRRGIGSELMKAAVEHVKSTGRGKLKLFTRPWNTAMAKTCIAVGLVPEAYLRKDYLGEDLVLYSAFLNDP